VFTFIRGKTTYMSMKLLRAPIHYLLKSAALWLGRVQQPLPSYQPFIEWRTKAQGALESCGGRGNVQSMPARTMGVQARARNRGGEEGGEEVER